MQLSTLVKECNLFCSEKPRVCPDGLAQYVGLDKLSTVITKNGNIVKVLDDHSGLKNMILYQDYLFGSDYGSRIIFD